MYILSFWLLYSGMIWWRQSQSRRKIDQLFQTGRSSQCVLVVYNEVHPQKLSPAFDQTREVLELQSRVTGSPEAHICFLEQFASFVHCCTCMGEEIILYPLQVATTLLVGNCYRAHIATFLGHLCLYIWLTPINTHIKCHNINVSNGHQWEEQSAQWHKKDVFNKWY